MADRERNELIAQIGRGGPSDEVMARVERIQEIITKFDSDPQLKDHYRKGFLANDLERDGYTPDEIDFAEWRISNVKRSEAIGRAVNRGDIAIELLGEIPF